MSDVHADGVHVSFEEARQARDPNVGAGTPLTAPDFEFPEEEQERVLSGKLPTKKWLSAFGTALLLFVASRFTEVDKDLEQFINIAAPLIVGYIVPNDDTPGGVPDAVEVR